jgi:hypothetical protein
MIAAAASVAALVQGAQILYSLLILHLLQIK